MCRTLCVLRPKVIVLDAMISDEHVGMRHCCQLRSNGYKILDRKAFSGHA